MAFDQVVLQFGIWKQPRISNRISAVSSSSRTAYIARWSRSANKLIVKPSDVEYREISWVHTTDRVFRIKRGLLRVHEINQLEQYSYWRSVVPDNEEVKKELLREIHCVPYVGHPGFTRTLEVTRRFFYWVHMTQEVRQFVLDCPVCQVEKGSHLKPAGKVNAPRSPYEEMGPCCHRLCSGIASAGKL